MKLDLNNTVIEVLNREHGQEVKKFFEANGINTNPWKFSCTKEEQDIKYFYGMVKNEFSSYTLNEVNSANAKIIELPKKEELPLPRYMMCWDRDESNAIKRLVWHIHPETKEKSRFEVIGIDDEENFKFGRNYLCFTYNYAKEMPIENLQKQILLDKAEELIQKANELKEEANKL